MYFFLGRHDHNVAADLSAAYFETISAPRKELVYFEESAHWPMREEAAKYTRELVRRLAPGGDVSAPE